MHSAHTHTQKKKHSIKSSPLNYKPQFKSKIWFFEKHIYTECPIFAYHQLHIAALDVTMTPFQLSLPLILHECSVCDVLL